MAASQEECRRSGDRPDDGGGVCTARGISTGADLRQATVRELPIPASQTRADPQGRDVQDEEAGYPGGNGPDRGVKHAQRPRGALRSGLHGVQLRLSPGKESAPGHPSFTGPGTGGEGMGRIGRPESVL